MDGKSIAYTRYGGSSPLFVQSIEGGPQLRLIDAVYSRGFAVTERGIYYTSFDSETRSYVVRLYDPGTSRSDLVGELKGLPYLNLGLTVSPDGRTVLVSASPRAGSDLFMVENFR